MPGVDRRGLEVCAEAIFCETLLITEASRQLRPTLAIPPELIPYNLYNGKSSTPIRFVRIPVVLAVPLSVSA